MEVYDSLVLHETPYKFFIEPTGNNDKFLALDRLSQEIRLVANRDEIPKNASKRPIFGIIGTIQLVACKYLVVITKCSRAGTVNGQHIWRIDESQILPFSRSILHLNEEQVKENQSYVTMIEHVLNTPNLYFSYTYDLTHTLQRLHNTMPEFLQMPLHERADERFVWNRHLIQEMGGHSDLVRFILPIMHGFVQTHHCSINRTQVTYTLISRRCCFRAGTRFFMRGVDSEGQVANYVETEQIVEYQGEKCSFVQTRGSIPIFWSQLPNIKYKPKPEASGTANHLEGLSRHFDTQVLNYGKQVIINLIDQKGAEGQLEKTFADVVTSFPSPFVKYEPFDFHHECRKMRYDRLQILLDRINPEQEEYGYFLLLKDGSVVQQQDGVFRTNCIDCLDRTNVVQSLLARRNLLQVFLKLGILLEGQRVEDQSDFEGLFKNVWADHADTISTQYSGTGALKTDFTRTGKRTKAGLLQDGYRSLMRYYKNNFADGFRQDSIDLFLGNHVVSSPARTDKKKKAMIYTAAPIIWCIALAMIPMTLLVPSEITTESLLYLLFWGAMAAASTSFIVRNGPEYVDWPKLVKRNRQFSVHIPKNRD